MISVVYTLGKSSMWSNNELRYSLRSIDNHLKGYGHVWIIGEKPDWLTNVNHKPATDHKNAVPDFNIMSKLVGAVIEPEISDTFLFMNDDHYLLQDVQADQYPYYYQGTIGQHVKKRGHDGYGRRCENTEKSLKARNLPTKYFDVHYPILYQKDLFMKNVFRKYGNEKDGMILKSLYANALHIEGTEIKDCKVPHLPLNDLPCFSTYPTVSRKAQQFLREKFPEKSKFEL